MEIFLLLTLLISGLCLAHTYWIYPRLVRWLAGKKSFPIPAFPKDPPFVSVLMAVYNEEQVIAQKLDTLLRLHYPGHQLRFFIGSDHSTDATNDIVATYCAQDERFFFFRYRERKGKPGIINLLSFFSQT